MRRLASFCFSVLRSRPRLPKRLAACLIASISQMLNAWVLRVNIVLISFIGRFDFGPIPAYPLACQDASEVNLGAFLGDSVDRFNANATFGPPLSGHLPSSFLGEWSDLGLTTARHAAFASSLGKLLVHGDFVACFKYSEYCVNADKRPSQYETAA